MPENFEGKIVYEISGEHLNPHDTDSLNYQVIYAKDSMVRVENFTTIGKQIYIKHIPKNKAYILMELYGRKFAIQSFEDDAPNKGKYKFTTKRGSKRIAGRKTKKVLVEVPDIDSTFSMNYFVDIPPKYSEAIPGMPGLPAKYTLNSGGKFMDFKALQVEERMINDDFFGVPTSYQIVTMDEFMEYIEEMESR